MIYTSYYDNLEFIPDNIIPISIAGKCHDNYKGLEFKVLAPKWEFFSKWKYMTKGYESCYQNEEYYCSNFYEKVLMKLNPIEIYNRLMKLSKGKDVVLLCYEPIGLFCHRHLVCQWFNDNNIKCEEYIVEPIVY